MLINFNLGAISVDFEAIDPNDPTAGYVVLSNTLNLMNLSSFHIDMVKGGVILAAALLDVLRTRLMRERAT